MDGALRGLWQRLVNVAVAVLMTALLVGAGIAVAVLMSDHLTLRLLNGGATAVAVTGCGDDVAVPAGASVVATRTCWRARELVARAGTAVVDRVTVPRSGAYLYDVAGRGGLLLVDYSAAYAQANEYRLPPDAQAKVAADLRVTRLVPLARAHAVLDLGTPLPAERIVGSRVLRVERAPPTALDPAQLQRFFTERMRDELTPASLRPVRLDFHPVPRDAGAR